MSDQHTTYDNPLIARYASARMSELWSPQRKFSTWRRLWVALAEAEAELGLAVTPEQIAELKRHVDDIDFAAAERHERRLRHDVMAHVHAYGDVCPAARPIIHLGATSCYVTDNTDLMLLREALEMVRDRLVAVIDGLARFAQANRDLPCLAFTHFQPAQPTTVGKRACLWAYDFVLDLAEIEFRLENLKAHGCKGTTGTQASFLELFGGDHDKVRRLDELICRKIGFAESYPVTGQTYPRKIDSQVLAVLSGIAQSAHKMATDLRLLAHRKEVEEPFEKEQIGSSAMAYKRNPMRSERICSLARFVMSLETERRRDGRRAMAGADAGRQRQPPAGAAAVVPGHRCRADPLPERDRRAGRLSAGDRGEPGGRVALHGHGEHLDGRAWRPAATGRSCTSGSVSTAWPRRRW